MYFVYLLQSRRDNGFYIGMTSNIQSRFEEHENGLVESTKNRRPWKLIYFEAYLSKESAEERERKLKNFGSSYVGLLKRLGLK